MNTHQTNPPLPPGYRLLRKGEQTRPGDIGCIDPKKGWYTLWAGHVVFQEVVREGNTARKLDSEYDKP